MACLLKFPSGFLYTFCPKLEAANPSAYRCGLFLRKPGVREYKFTKIAKVGGDIYIPKRFLRLLLS